MTVTEWEGLRAAASISNHALISNNGPHKPSHVILFFFNSKRKFVLAVMLQSFMFSDVG